MIRFAQMVDNSVVDGLGIRLVVFLQGCVRFCEGCHNPELIPAEGGTETTEEALANAIVEKITPLHKGVTFTGGDPLMQAEALAVVIQLVKEKCPDIDIWVYTGYVFEQVKEWRVMPLIDVLVDGPFMEDCRDLGFPFRGSRNQRIIDVKRSLANGSVAELEV